MTEKRLVVLTESIARAIDEDSEKTGAPVSAIIRQILAEHYQKQGRPVDKHVDRGGWRPRRKDAEPA